MQQLFHYSTFQTCSLKLVEDFSEAQDIYLGSLLFSRDWSPGLETSCQTAQIHVA